MTVFLQLHKGTSIFSRLIKWQTRGQYSHASVWFYDASDPEGGVVIESMEGHGVRCVPASHMRAAREAGRIDLYTVPSLTAAQRQAVYDFMHAEIGNGYDWQAVFKFITRRQHAHDDKWFCSELVFAAFQAAGVILLRGVEAWSVWPSQLPQSPWVERYQP